MNLLFHEKQSAGQLKMTDHLSNTQMSDEETPDYVNNFFANIGNNIQNSLNFNLDLWTYDGDEYPPRFSLRDVTIEQVIKEVCNLKITEPSGIENISTKLLKDAFWSLSHQLTLLFNLIIETNEIPTSWKCAKITPIPKDGDLSDVNNFRPIAILPVVSKVLEYLIHDQTMSYLEQNDILDSHQGGFRKDHSTTSTTANLFDDFYLNINAHQLTYATFIDFWKAFDSINHEIFLKKLSKIGCSLKTVN